MGKEFRKTLTDGKRINYNDWEKVVIKTTTNGIPMVVVNYNDWEIASSNYLGWKWRIWWIRGLEAWFHW